jgi:short-subunit dehydrogenase
MRQMERQGSGAIVNNASVGALTGNLGIGSYIASKLDGGMTIAT